MPVFIRKTKDYDMEINFIKNTCTFNFENEGTSKVDLVTNFKFKDEKVKLDYKLDIDTTKIVVEII